MAILHASNQYCLTTSCWRNDCWWHVVSDSAKHRCLHLTSSMKPKNVHHDQCHCIRAAGTHLFRRGVPYSPLRLRQTIPVRCEFTDRPLRIFDTPLLGTQIPMYIMRQESRCCGNPPHRAVLEFVGTIRLDGTGPRATFVGGASGATLIAAFDSELQITLPSGANATSLSPWP